MVFMANSLKCFDLKAVERISIKHQSDYSYNPRNVTATAIVTRK